MSSEIAIKVENLSKCYHIYDKPEDRLKQAIFPKLNTLLGRETRDYYREFWALRNVSFEIKKGETIGIVGKNGAGKSTLLQILTGTLAPTSGGVQINGRLAALLELGSGFNPEFTGRENIYLNGAILGLARKEIEEKLDDILTFADIGDFIDQPVKTYSTGMYVRLAFAIQANIAPEILIVDEALAVGDAYFVHKCMDRLHQLQENGTSILLVTHDSFFVKRFCQRAIWLKEGTVEESGSAVEVVDRYLEWLFQTPASHLAAINNTEIQIQENDGPRERNVRAQRRLGDGSCMIKWAVLMDSEGSPLNTVTSNSEIVLEYEVGNRSLLPTDELIFGYIVRNSRGEEISATNSYIEGRDEGIYHFESLCSQLIVRAQIRLPSLMSDHYSISVGAAYRKVGSVGFIVADRLINELIFYVDNEKKINTLMSFDTTFRVALGEGC